MEAFLHLIIMAPLVAKEIGTVVKQEGSLPWK